MHGKIKLHLRDGRQGRPQSTLNCVEGSLIAQHESIFVQTPTAVLMQLEGSERHVSNNDADYGSIKYST